jgi:hypothetical protein
MTPQNVYQSTTNYKLFINLFHTTHCFFNQITHQFVSLTIQHQKAYIQPQYTINLHHLYLYQHILHKNCLFTNIKKCPSPNIRPKIEYHQYHTKTTLTFSGLSCKSLLLTNLAKVEHQEHLIL